MDVLSFGSGNEKVRFFRQNFIAFTRNFSDRHAKQKIAEYIASLNSSTSIAPLVVFRIAFGAIMFISIVRFILKGWVYDLYIRPEFHFTYYGLGWVRPLGDSGMYILFAVMALSALFLMAGFIYRLSSITFFLTFTYVELIDKATYLNHYYFVSIVSFLLIFLPANRYFSIDSWLFPSTKNTLTPKWTIDIIKFQMGIVYFFAGLAKLNSDWLLEGLPLRIWLPAHNNFPLIGFLFNYSATAFVFSWVGLFYDLTIPFLLLFRRTRAMAFVLVVVFHGLTALLFPIGMFPYIMILSTLIFFSNTLHSKFLILLKRIFKNENLRRQRKIHSIKDPAEHVVDALRLKPWGKVLLTTFLLFQLLTPIRFLLYPGNLFWTEQGYRFSWRVMLMEKNGVAFFYVRDPETGNEWEATNRNFLTSLQEKMMASQPDMILQFAHFLESYYKKQGIKDPEVRVKSFVTLNGRASKALVNENVDLTREEESFANKTWITSLEKN